ncbi:hypothetical protein S40288_11076 [Stachybotrys chartarum IBT 40288]|nr:hypothetical protein S40288_11076 [Stachybotrys chartarum IBT 40288]
MRITQIEAVTEHDGTEGIFFQAISTSQPVLESFDGNHTPQHTIISTQIFQTFLRAAPADLVHPRVPLQSSKQGQQEALRNDQARRYCAARRPDGPGPPRQVRRHALERLLRNARVGEGGEDSERELGEDAVEGPACAPGGLALRRGEVG